MKLNFLFTIIILLFQSLTFSQQNKLTYFQAYEKTISGNELNYHSPLPDVKTSLLVRANELYNSIEWETETIPKNYNDDFLTFIWMFGIDVNVDSHEFDLFINEKKILTFSNPKSNEDKVWKVKGKAGSELLFRSTMTDKYGDFMGFAILKVPTSFITPGEAVKILISGDNKNSNSWYMTFKTQVLEKIEIIQDPVLIKINNKSFHSLRFSIVILDDNIEGGIIIDDFLNKTVKLVPGNNSFTINIPEVKTQTEYLVKVKIGGNQVVELPVKLKPIKEWMIYFVQHTHTDIGYTRPQTEILPEHLRFIDYALDFCDLTDNYPENSKFRWTCEASWAVREYLKSRPLEQIERLRKRINEGRIEVTGMFFNMSELLDETSLAAQLQPIRTFRENGLKVETVMQNDVNGIGWALAEYFSDIGIKYLIMGEHSHRALLPFDKPTTFWWESPSGKRILAFRGEHYMQGNKLGIHTKNLEFFESNLLNYLDELNEKEYPFNCISLQYSGYVTDNSPPALTACELVKRWNNKYEWPQIKIATANEFMKSIEKNHSAELPVFRAAWPDWWTDGAGSACREAGASRKTHAELIANQGLLSMAKLSGAELPSEINKDIEEIMDNLLFYDEHTYSAAESITDPRCENTMIQWAEKSAYVWEAVKKSALLKEKAMGFIQPFINKTDVPVISVFNTLNWQRSGLVEVYIDHEILPANKKFRMVDENNNEILAQSFQSREDGTYWGIWAENIPAFGYKSYRIEVFQENRKLPEIKDFSGVFENEYYSLEIDENTGAVNSLFDKILQMELSDTSCKWQIGQFIYEKLSNRQQIEQLRLEKAERSTLENIEIKSVVDGPIWKSLFIHGESPICADSHGVNLEIRLYKKEKRIEFLYDMYKLPVFEPEAVYIAFPFRLPDGELFFEGQGGVIKPGRDQLPGTSSDWNVIQNFACVKNNENQIIFGSEEIPLVQLGGLNMGKFSYYSNPEKPYIFSWVLNNYWTTNFLASQEGELKWSYYITSSDNESNSEATRFAWGSRIPFLTRVLPAGNNEELLSTNSLLKINFPNILLINAKPSIDGNGVILLLRETSGKSTEIEINEILKNNKYNKVSVVNALEYDLQALISKLVFKPFETRFVKLF